MNTGTIKIEATTKQISLKIKETYTWFEKPKSYCLNITVKITVRQRTLIRTLFLGTICDLFCQFSPKTADDKLC